MSKESGTLDTLCREMEGIDISLDQVRARFLQHYKIAPTEDMGLSVGRMGEMHTLARVEELMRKHQGILKVYRFEGIKSRGGYSFHASPYGAPNITVRVQKRKRPIAELDLVLLVEGHPVIVETHLSRYRGCKPHCLAYQLRVDTIARKKKHVVRLLGCSPEMVYVIPKEYVGKKETPESIMAEFLQRGNHIVPFPMNRQQWRAEAEQVLFTSVG